MASRKNQWTEGQEQLLFKLQAEHGNRWSVIATKLAPKKDSCVKNKFYSTLRKGLRKINKYITQIKKKSDPIRLKGYKTLQQMFITKLIAVVDNNFEQKYEVKQKALDLSQHIQKRVIEIARNDKQYLKQQFTDYTLQEELLRDIHQFNKNCKKRKGKRKTKDQSGPQSENDQMDLSQEIKQQYILTLQHGQIDDNKNGTKIVEKSDSFGRNSYLVPQTKQNIILTAENNSDNDTQAKLKMCGDKQKNNKKEQSSFIQKKESFSTSICNTMPLVLKTEESQLIIDQINILNSTSYNLNGSWLFQSINSRDLSKKISGFLTHPSPLPSDTSNPFTFGNLMKNSNFTTSSTFQQKSNASQMLSTSKFYQNVMQEKTLSLLDQLPMFVPNCLIKSADMLQQSTEMINNSQNFNNSQNYKENCMTGKQTCTSMTFQKKLNGTIQAFFPVFPNNDFFKIDGKNLEQQYNFAGECLLPIKAAEMEGKILESKDEEIEAHKINEL